MAWYLQSLRTDSVNRGFCISFLMLAIVVLGDSLELFPLSSSSSSRNIGRSLTLATISPSAYNYDLPTCHPRTMANCARTSMLISKRRFSTNSSSILSGEGFDERERGESLFVLA